MTTLTSATPRRDNMATDHDPAGDASALTASMSRLDLLDGPSPRWQDWQINSPASEHKAMMARFKADHPQDNLPWGYAPL